MRHDSRGKSLNGIRQICNAADRYKGLLWIFTETPEFYDTKRGVAGLEPLSDRIQYLNPGGFASPRQPQLELKPFDARRLKEVALKLREKYPTVNKTALTTKVTSEFIEKLVNKVTTGFKGDVGVVPRQFLRQFVNVLDLACENEEPHPHGSLRQWHNSSNLGKKSVNIWTKNKASQIISKTLLESETLRPVLNYHLPYCL